VLLTVAVNSPICWRSAPRKKAAPPSSAQQAAETGAGLARFHSANAAA
jgi:hypothetical protein